MGQFFSSVDWIEVFTPQAPLIETFVRGSLLYLGLVVLLRITPARETGAVGTPDLLVILLLADAAQNAMAGPHHAVGDGFALLVTILAWSVVLDWLGYRSAFFHRLLRTPPARLVRDGRVLAAGLRRGAHDTRRIDGPTPKAGDRGRWPGQRGVDRGRRKRERHPTSKRVIALLPRAGHQPSRAGRAPNPGALGRPFGFGPRGTIVDH
jgi:hypothetical protein